MGGLIEAGANLNISTPGISRREALSTTCLGLAVISIAVGGLFILFGNPHSKKTVIIGSVVFGGCALICFVISCLLYRDPNKEEGRSLIGRATHINP